jgi:hypothetical protein
MTMSFLRFHSNEHNTKREHYYGYGSVIDKREFSGELDSCVRRLVEFGRVL